MNNIGLFNETNIKVLEFDELKPLLEYALKKENVDNCEFNVILVNNDKIKEINKLYRSKDNVTDVISFALEDNKEFVFNDHRVLGDIYISLDKAKEQAKDYEHSLKREISFLAVHGLLHLLGYDHMSEIEEKNMFLKQEEILNEFGIERKK
jgi:probable rRNA maturation factor